MNAIIEQVANYYKVKPEQITEKCRKEPLATIRAITMVLLYDSGIPDTKVGCMLGVCSGGASWTMRHRIADRAEVDATIASDLNNLRDGKSSEATVATEWENRKEKMVKQKRDSYKHHKVGEYSGTYRHPDSVEIEYERDGIGFGSLKILEQQLQNL